MARKDRIPRIGALGELKEAVKQAGIHLKSEAIAPPPEPVKQHEAAPESEEELFDRAMQGVRLAEWQHTTVSSPKPRPVPQDSSGVEELQIMRQSLEGELAPLAHEHPEYIESWVNVVGKRYLPKLRNGMYSIQEQLDLHGFNRVEARAVVEDFIFRMSRFRSCCVKIIHGRGINSPNDQAILKDNLQRWLSTRRMSKYVVAYASAPLNDGGVGAIYVLLRHP